MARTILDCTLGSQTTKTEANYTLENLVLPVRFGNRNHSRMAKSLALKRPLALVVNAVPGKSTKPIVNRFPPIIPHKIEKPYHPFQDAGCPFLAKVNTTDLAQDSACEFAEKRALRERRQITPDAITELGLSEEQYHDLKARVNRRFLVGYDCSKPMEVKPISSFIRDPCEPVEDNDKATYDIQSVTQFQVVQYETRREFLGVRCERYISQFTYYCGNADHASPLASRNLFSGDLRF